MATHSSEITKFYNHFKTNCKVKVVDVIEERTFFHWKRLVFNDLNCEEMLEVATYIKNTFSTKGNYSHLLPTLHTYNDRLCLTVDVSEINKKIK